jgi:cell division protease FtsH
LGQEIAQRRQYSEATAREIDEEIMTILDESYGRAMETLKENRGALEQLVQLLQREEEVPGEKVTELLEESGAEQVATKESEIEKEKEVVAP